MFLIQFPHSCELFVLDHVLNMQTLRLVTFECFENNFNLDNGVFEQSPYSPLALTRCLIGSNGTYICSSIPMFVFPPGDGFESGFFRSVLQMSGLSGVVSHLLRQKRVQLLELRHNKRTQKIIHYEGTCDDDDKKSLIISCYPQIF